MGQKIANFSFFFFLLRCYLRDAAIQLCIDNHLGMLAYFMTQVYEPLAHLWFIPNHEEFSMYLTQFIKTKGMDANSARVSYFPNYLLSKYHYIDNSCYWWLKEYAFKHFLSRTRSSVRAIPWGDFVRCEEPRSKLNRVNEAGRRITNFMKPSVTRTGIPDSFPQVFVPRGQALSSLEADEVVIVDPAHYAYPIFCDSETMKRDSLVLKPLAEGWMFLRDIFDKDNAWRRRHGPPLDDDDDDVVDEAWLRQHGFEVDDDDDVLYEEREDAPEYMNRREERPEKKEKGAKRPRDDN